MLYSPFPLTLTLVLLAVSEVWSTSPTAAPSKARSLTQKVKSIAGIGAYTTSGTGGKATSAGVYLPESVWQDTTGTVFIAGNDYCVRKFDLTTNIIVSHVGVCGGLGNSGNNGPATSAKFGQSAAFGDSMGSIYVIDNNYRDVRYTQSGMVYLLFGTSAYSDTGDGGPATSATLTMPTGVWVSSVGVVYVGCYSSYAIRAVTVSTGIVTRFAG